MRQQPESGIQRERRRVAGPNLDLNGLEHSRYLGTGSSLGQNLAVDIGSPLKNASTE